MIDNTSTHLNFTKPTEISKNDILRFDIKLAKPKYAQSF